MPPPKVHDAALREALLRATSRLVAERGAEAVTVRTAAGAADTSTSAVYTLFGGREQLLSAVAAEAVARFAARLAAVPDADDPAAHLLDLGRAYRASALAEPHFYRVMFDAGPGRLREADRDLPSTFAMLVHAVQQCIDAGLCASSDARELASTLWALVHGLVELELADLLDGPHTARSRSFHAALQHIWLGLAAR